MNEFAIQQLSTWAECTRQRRIGAQLWTCLPGVCRVDAELAMLHGAHATKLIDHIIEYHTATLRSVPPADVAEICPDFKQIVDESRIAVRHTLLALGLSHL